MCVFNGTTPSLVCVPLVMLQFSEDYGCFIDVFPRRKGGWVAGKKRKNMVIINLRKAKNKNRIYFHMLQLQMCISFARFIMISFPSRFC